VQSDQAIKIDERIRDVLQMGRTATLTIQGFDNDLKARLERDGVSIQAVERMSLEEVFVAEVEAKRRGAPS